MKRASGRKAGKNFSKKKYSGSGSGSKSSSSSRWNKPNSGKSKSRSTSNLSKFGSRNSSSNSRPSRYKSSSGRGRYNKRPKTSKTIDISLLVKKASKTEEKAYQAKHTFADFDFSQKLQNNLNTISFITPTPIQDQAIPYIVNNQDVIGLANTGTGKTGAFLLPLIEKIYHDTSKKALIMAPTRELAIQIQEDFKVFARGLNIYSSVCIGGASIFRQLKELKRNPHVIIGTPGRLKDLYKRQAIDYKTFNFIVLDEVDRMLDMGFIDIIKEILNLSRKDKQSLFFSATMPDSIKKLINQFLHKPVTIDIQSGQTADNVDQDVIRVKDADTKFDKLNEVLNQPEVRKVLIFSETKRSVEKLAVSLDREGHLVDSIHGDKRQRERQRSLTKFRDDKINILVATDVAARGLDIKDITHVINYTMPQSYDDYVHRIGRTGRGTKKGLALTFV